jgi:hypothetical protein
MGFSSQLDWSGTGGGLQVDLAEDECHGDAFDPPGVGYPVLFSMGAFSYGGILQSWKESDSATDAKYYTVNVSGPREIVAGCQVILNSYNGPTMGVPNLVNVYGWLEAAYGGLCSESGFTGDVDPGLSGYLTYPPAPGYGGALNSEMGIPWNLILISLNILLNTTGSTYGEGLKFRSHRYYVDLSEMPLMSGVVRIPGESMDLDSLIAHVCHLSGRDYFYELITIGDNDCTGGLSHVIKVHVSTPPWQSYDASAELVDSACGSDIEARLSLGKISGAIDSASCVHSQGRGLELRNEVTNAMITGEFRQDIWQMPYSGEGDGNDTIWPYWGKNPDGTIIIGEEYSDGTFPEEQDETDHGHHFVAKTEHLGIGVDSWDVTVLELQAALAGRTEWEAWLGEFEPAKFAQMYGVSEQSVRDKFGGHIGNRLAQALKEGVTPDQALMKALDLVNLKKGDVQNIGKDTYDEKHNKITILFDFLRKFAQEYYGKKFLVKLPFLCKRYDPDTPWTFETSWECSDSGWTEWPVLGIPNNHWVLNQFRTDDGKIRCFLKFTSNKPMILDNLSKEDHFAIDLYNVFVAGTADEIVWLSPTDARVVVTLSGPIKKHNPYNVLPEHLLAFALLGHIHEFDRTRFLQPLKSPTNDKSNLGMEQPFLMPVAAAVPLQSTRLVYGPWFAKPLDFGGFNFFVGGSFFRGDDKGKTVYSRETGFAPWHFGNFQLLNICAYNTAVSMLGDKYVVEMGDITIPGAPTGSIGDYLVAGGPIISSIDVQIGRGSGAVTTTYRMKTHTPDTAAMAKYRLEQVRHALKVGMNANRIFKKFAMERLRNQFQSRLDQQLLAWKTKVGLSGTSSHDLMGGQACEDADGPSHDNEGYEAATQADEPHAETVMNNTEGRKELLNIRGDSNAYYRRRAYMENIGMFRPFSTLPHTKKASEDDAYFIAHWRDDINHDLILSDGGGTETGRAKLPPEAGCPTGEGGYLTNNVDYFSHEQVPPIFCKEHHLPINITTLSPFLSRGRSLLPGWSEGGVCMSPDPDASKGHDIEYIARDGVYPTHLSVRHPGDNYSTKHWYRAIALRGPLVLAGWGFDIDNKPVPNASTDYPNNPKMQFEQDWLRKPQKWMCGPVDLRWDYKRNVWTAPTPMKPVKLELIEHLCPGGSANAILYNDQVQYDNNGAPLDVDNECEKYGYKVKVFSNAMYPVPKGWHIMAYFDTTLNHYQLINHDPLPIVVVNITEDMLCGGVEGGGVIVGPAGSMCNLDPCGALSGMSIRLMNTLNQPICQPRKCFAWICGFECSEEGEPGPTLDDCEAISPQPIRAHGVILQAEFKPSCVVTHLELLEYKCWANELSEDEDDIVIWSQGAVEVCDDTTVTFTPDCRLIVDDEHPTAYVTVYNECELDCPPEVQFTPNCTIIHEPYGECMAEVVVTCECDCTCNCETTTGTTTFCPWGPYFAEGIIPLYIQQGMVPGGDTCDCWLLNCENSYAILDMAQIAANLTMACEPTSVDFDCQLTGCDDSYGEVDLSDIASNISLLCEESTLTFEVDARFIPGACTLTVKVMNKNYYEYYWYALCICTRALWHEGEFGPASCGINTTPVCDLDCDAIQCTEPTYTCSAYTPSKPVGELTGSYLRWEGIKDDDELLVLETDCTEIDNSCGSY